MCRTPSSLYITDIFFFKAFADPASVRGSDEAWSELVSRLEAALQVFASFGEDGSPPSESPEDALEEPNASASAAAAPGGGDAPGAEAAGGGGGGGGGGGSTPQELQEVYFAKFLTSPKLIQLQLRDTYFRRHLIVQVPRRFPPPTLPPPSTPPAPSLPTHPSPPNVP